MALAPFIMEVDMSDFNRLVDRLEVNISEAIRPAAQAAAQVTYRSLKPLPGT